MGDVVTGKCVIGRVEAYSGEWKSECLLFRVRGEFHLIYMRPKGTPVNEGAGRPQWEYEERDGRLHLQPSLLVTAGPNKGFHTDYNWNVDFVRPRKRQNPHKLFHKLNPSPNAESV